MYRPREESAGAVAAAEESVMPGSSSSSSGNNTKAQVPYRNKLSNSNKGKFKKSYSEEPTTTSGVALVETTVGESILLQSGKNNHHPGKKKSFGNFWSNLFGHSNNNNNNNNNSRVVPENNKRSSGISTQSSSFESVNTILSTNSFSFVSPKKYKGKAAKGKRIPVSLDNEPSTPGKAKRKMSTLTRIGMRIGLKSKYNLQSCESLHNLNYNLESSGGQSGSVSGANSNVGTLSSTYRRKRRAPAPPPEEDGQGGGGMTLLPPASPRPSTSKAGLSSPPPHPQKKTPPSPSTSGTVVGDLRPGEVRTKTTDSGGSPAVVVATETKKTHLSTSAAQSTSKEPSTISTAEPSSSAPTEPSPSDTNNKTPATTIFTPAIEPFKITARHRRCSSEGMSTRGEGSSTGPSSSSTGSSNSNSHKPTFKIHAHTLSNTYKTKSHVRGKRRAPVPPNPFGDPDAPEEAEQQEQQGAIGLPTATTTTTTAGSSPPSHEEGVVGSRISNSSALPSAAKTNINASRRTTGQSVINVPCSSGSSGGGAAPNGINAEVTPPNDSPRLAAVAVSPSPAASSPPSPPPPATLLSPEQDEEIAQNILNDKQEQIRSAAQLQHSQQGGRRQEGNDENRPGPSSSSSSRTPRELNKRQQQQQQQQQTPDQQRATEMELEAAQRDLQALMALSSSSANKKGGGGSRNNEGDEETTHRAQLAKLKRDADKSPLMFLRPKSTVVVGSKAQFGFQDGSSNTNNIKDHVRNSTAFTPPGSPTATSAPGSSTTSPWDETHHLSPLHLPGSSTTNSTITTTTTTSSGSVSPSKLTPRPWYKRNIISSSSSQSHKKNKTLIKPVSSMTKFSDIDREASRIVEENRRRSAEQAYNETARELITMFNAFNHSQLHGTENNGTMMMMGVDMDRLLEAENSANETSESRLGAAGSSSTTTTVGHSPPVSPAGATTTTTTTTTTLGAKDSAAPSTTSAVVPSSTDPAPSSSRLQPSTTFKFPPYSSSAVATSNSDRGAKATTNAAASIGTAPASTSSGSLSTSTTKTTTTTTTNSSGHSSEEPKKLAIVQPQSSSRVLSSSTAPGSKASSSGTSSSSSSTTPGTDSSTSKVSVGISTSSAFLSSRSSNNNNNNKENWSCPRCTLQNSHWRVTCDVCYFNKGESSSSAQRLTTSVFNYTTPAGVSPTSTRTNNGNEAGNNEPSIKSQVKPNVSISSCVAPGNSSSSSSSSRGSGPFERSILNSNGGDKKVEGRMSQTMSMTKDNNSLLPLCENFLSQLPAKQTLAREGKLVGMKLHQHHLDDNPEEMTTPTGEELDINQLRQARLAFFEKNVPLPDSYDEDNNNGLPAPRVTKNEARDSSSCELQGSNGNLYGEEEEEEEEEEDIDNSNVGFIPSNNLALEPNNSPRANNGGRREQVRLEKKELNVFSDDEDDTIDALLQIPRLQQPGFGNGNTSGSSNNGSNSSTNNKENNNNPQLGPVFNGPRNWNPLHQTRFRPMLESILESSNDMYLRLDHPNHPNNHPPHPNSHPIYENWDLSQVCAFPPAPTANNGGATPSSPQMYTQEMLMLSQLGSSNNSNRAWTNTFMPMHELLHNSPTDNNNYCYYPNNSNSDSSSCSEYEGQGGESNNNNNNNSNNNSSMDGKNRAPSRRHSSHHRHQQLFYQQQQHPILEQEQQQQQLFYANQQPSSSSSSSSQHEGTASSHRRMTLEDYRKLGAIPKNFEGYYSNISGAEDGSHNNKVGSGSGRGSDSRMSPRESRRHSSFNEFRSPSDADTSYTSESSSTYAKSTLAVNKLLRKLELAIAKGDHRLAASLAHDLALLKVSCVVAKGELKSTPITIRVYVEDRFMQQGPFQVQVTQSMTVQELKSKIEKDWSIPSPFQKWILGRKMAEDETQTLLEFDVEHDTMAFLYIVTPQIEKGEPPQAPPPVSNSPKAIKGKDGLVVMGTREQGKTPVPVPAPAAVPPKPAVEEPGPKSGSISAPVKQGKQQQQQVPAPEVKGEQPHGVVEPKGREAKMNIVRSGVVEANKVTGSMSVVRSAATAAGEMEKPKQQQQQQQQRILVNEAVAGGSGRNVNVVKEGLPEPLEKVMSAPSTERKGNNINKPESNNPPLVQKIPEKQQQQRIVVAPSTVANSPSRTPTAEKKISTEATPVKKLLEPKDVQKSPKPAEVLIKTYAAPPAVNNILAAAPQKPLPKNKEVPAQQKSELRNSPGLEKQQPKTLQEEPAKPSNVRPSNVKAKDLPPAPLVPPEPMPVKAVVTAIATEITRKKSTPSSVSKSEAVKPLAREFSKPVVVVGVPSPATAAVTPKQPETNDPNSHNNSTDDVPNWNPEPIPKRRTKNVKKTETSVGLGLTSEITPTKPKRTSPDSNNGVSTPSSSPSPSLPGAAAASPAAIRAVVNQPEPVYSNGPNKETLPLDITTATTTTTKKSSTPTPPELPPPPLPEKKQINVVKEMNKNKEVSRKGLSPATTPLPPNVPENNHQVPPVVPAPGIPSKAQQQAPVVPASTSSSPPPRPPSVQEVAAAAVTRTKSPQAMKVNQDIPVAPSTNTAAAASSSSPVAVVIVEKTIEDVKTSPPSPPPQASSATAAGNEKEDNRETYQRMLHLMEQSDLISNTEELECPICFSPVQVNEGVILRDCLHSFCKECLIGSVQYADEPEVKCPFRDDSYSCNSVMQEREIKALVPTEIFERHLARSVKVAECKIVNTFHCKTADCTGWCVFEDDVNLFNCPVCKKRNCLTCQAIHESVDCQQYQRQLAIDSETDENAKSSRLMLEKMIQRGEALECPACHVVLLKKWGCDWVRCSYCKTEICWITKGFRWGPNGKGDTSGGCRCGINGVKCSPKCTYCH